MIERPTSREIENLIHRTQSIREKWMGNPGYARCLDIELHALRLLLFTTRITEEETNIVATLGIGGTPDD
ncbi:hypothetical protein I6F35_06565 [Bradyrhizobium sp. BRP22]|uniref:hypothetical protein n=1 Tax=Bradyrhizobium sp. BRP22 TaxID=2793821 RepID=UPI001CD79BE7|nr:hypothetical protein [Bradyrhizobium sp. BRP22]MCA1452884.1 hypothetical protein [Bradyrhizobium sp. BRP22]